MTVQSPSDDRQVRPAFPADSHNAPAATAVSAADTVVAPSGLLKAIVFFGGFASIGSELAISRLIAPYFGASTFIWATIIGLNLTFLSLGYWWGGRVADRRPSARVLFSITSAAAVAMAFIPLLARPILASSLAAFQNLDVGAFYGALIGTLLLMALPLTLLGFVTPYAIRLRLQDVRAAGNTAGSIYALSTVGSIAGSFVPVLLLIPNLGTARTFVTLGLALLIPSIAGLASVRAFGRGALAGAAALLLPLAAAAQPAGVRPPEGGVMLTERESTYNYIQVVQEDGRNLLILNDGHAVHSIYDPTNLLTGGPWDYFMAAPLVVDGAAPNSVRRAMFVGLAGGTAARQLTAAYGPIPIDGVEIDPEVVEVADEYFGLGELPNVNAVVADGRYALRTSSERYDLIGVDAYRQPYIPFQLTSKEFFGEVSDHLTPTGVAVVNVGRTQTDYRLVDAIASTMAHEFDHVYAVDVDRYLNTIVIGTNAPSSIDNLAANAEGFPTDSPVRPVVGWIVAGGNPRTIEPGPIAFTDDKAPVEQVIDEMIFDTAREVTGQ